MDNPYWYSDGQKHHINIETIEVLCFELLNIFEASRPIADNFKLQEVELEEEQTFENFPLIQLHQKHTLIQTSKILLQIALMVRTFDDQFKDFENGEAYKNYVEEIDDGHYVGVMTGHDTFNYREACNKIIHAAEVRPLYERIDRESAAESGDKNLDQDIWYLTGEIDFCGKFHGNDWNATIHIQEFIEVILSVIRFRVGKEVTDDEQ